MVETIEFVGGPIDGKLREISNDACDPFVIWVRQRNSCDAMYIRTDLRSPYGYRVFEYKSNTGNWMVDNTDG